MFSPRSQPVRATSRRASPALLTMLAWGLGSGRPAPSLSMRSSTRLWREAAVATSCASCSPPLTRRSTTRAAPSVMAPRDPAHVHARYSRAGGHRRARLWRRRSSPRSPRAASSGSRRRRATSSSSTCTRPSATTRRRRCTATTPSTASCSTGNRSHARRRGSRRCSATSTMPTGAQACCCSSASARLRARHGTLHLPRARNLLRAPRRAAGRLHLAAAAADAGGAVRDRPQRGRGLAAACIVGRSSVHGG